MIVNRRKRPDRLWGHLSVLSQGLSGREDWKDGIREEESSGTILHHLHQMSEFYPRLPRALKIYVPVANNKLSQD
jgi:hypothetical protein